MTRLSLDIKRNELGNVKELWSRGTTGTVKDVGDGEETNGRCADDLWTDQMERSEYGVKSKR